MTSEPRSGSLQALNPRPQKPMTSEPRSGSLQTPDASEPRSGSLTQPAQPDVVEEPEADNVSSDDEPDKEEPQDESESYIVDAIMVGNPSDPQPDPTSDVPDSPTSPLSPPTPPTPIPYSPSHSRILVTSSDEEEEPEEEPERKPLPLNLLVWDDYTTTDLDEWDDLLKVNFPDLKKKDRAGNDRYHYAWDGTQFAKIFDGTRVNRTAWICYNKHCFTPAGPEVGSRASYRPHTMLECPRFHNKAMELIQWPCNGWDMARMTHLQIMKTRSLASRLLTIWLKSYRSAQNGVRVCSQRCDMDAQCKLRDHPFVTFECKHKFCRKRVHAFCAKMHETQTTDSPTHDPEGAPSRSPSNYSCCDRKHHKETDYKHRTIRKGFKRPKPDRQRHHSNSSGNDQDNRSSSDRRRKTKRRANRIDKRRPSR